MAVEIRVPTLGESIVEATVGKWLKQVGDTVAPGEMLVDLETDKVVLEVPAPIAEAPPAAEVVMTAPPEPPPVVEEPPPPPPIPAPAAKNGLSLGTVPSSLRRTTVPAKWASSGAGPPN